MSLTLSGILEVLRSAAQGSPGLRAGYLTLVEVVLEGSWSAARECFFGWWQSAEALDVDGDGRQDVLDVGLSLSLVATASHSVSVGELVDRALHSGANRVAGLPFGRLLLGADAELQVAELSRVFRIQGASWRVLPPQRMCFSLRIRARSRRWAARTSGWRAFWLRQRR